MSEAGYLTGGFYQVYDNLESLGIPTNEEEWGETTRTKQQLGQGRLPEPHDHVQYAWLFFAHRPDADGAMKVVGGRQLFEEGDDERESHVWGHRSSCEQEVFASLAFDNKTAAWTPSRITCYLTEADDDDLPGFHIVGAKQITRDIESKQPFCTRSEWGDTSAHEQFIGVGQSWSKEYGWGFSQILLYLVRA